MAEKEVYDFLTVAYGYTDPGVPDYAYAIGILPQGDLTEESSKAGAIHIGVDGSEERISFSVRPTFYINLNWNLLSASNSGTIFDWYNDSAKANGMQRSFKYAWGDDHTYVVRFASNLPRSGNAMSRLGIKNIRMKILGRILDA